MILDLIKFGLGISAIVLGFFILIKIVSLVQRLDSWLYKTFKIQKWEDWANK